MLFRVPPFRVFEETEIEGEIFLEKFDLRTNGRDDYHFSLLTLKLLSRSNIDLLPEIDIIKSLIKLNEQIYFFQ